MPLTDIKIRSLRPQKTAFKVWDSGGLYLEISPAGGKWWRWKYRFAGKEKRLSFGVYPEVSLKAGREKRDIGPKQIGSGSIQAKPEKQKKSRGRAQRVLKR